MNSVMGLIFNESFVKKRDLWVPWTVHRTYWLLKNALLQKKKKTKTKRRRRADKLNPNAY